MNKALLNCIRPHYSDLTGYVSAAGEVDKDPAKAADLIFMNANENPYSLIDVPGSNRYPEPQPRALLEGYADLYGVKPSQIVATRGADEAIAVLTKLFCEPRKDGVVICPPTFGMYSVNANAAPGEIFSVPLLKEDGAFVLDVEGIVAAGKQEAAKIVYLCSPNNPTGNVFARSDIEAVITGLADDAVVILDETYIEFADDESFASVLEQYSNLIILRTLSKSYSMAGMRMGCMLCGDEAFIDLVKRTCLDAYPLPQESIQAALKVMRPDVMEQARKNIQTLLSERARLQDAFEASGQITHIYPSDGNFLLVEMVDAPGFLEHCAKQNVILRDFSDRPGTENCLRISIGLPEHNDFLLQLLEEF